MAIINNMIKTNQRNNNKLSKEDLRLRQNMLRAAIICAFHGNTEKIKGISAKIGTISHADFMYIDELISTGRFSKTREEICEFLSDNLDGFKRADDTYYYALRNL